MQKPFKFRYASELAGSLVLATVILFVVGVFLAGHAKGWFEGNFVVRAVFNTEEGSFGLKQGNEVMIRNTVAGRVGVIRPTDNGGMETTFTIKERFRPFVHTDSIAKVRKKFVAAGDAFVEIVPGSGTPVQEEVTLRCVRDEEIMETAQKLLKEAQEVVLPMLDEIQQILKHVNGILGSIDEGKGTVGTLVNDKKLAADVKSVVRSVDSLLQESEKTMADARKLLEGEGLIGTMASDPEMADEVGRVISNMNGLLVESQEALSEAKLLVQGAQRHWMIRRHVERIEKPRLASVEHMREERGGGAQERLERALAGARVENDSVEIAKTAHNLSVLMLVRGKNEAARRLLGEARTEWRAQGADAAQVFILEAAIARAEGEPTLAGKAAESAVVLSSGKDGKRETKLEATILLAEILCDAKDLAGAKRLCPEIASMSRKVDADRLKAMGSGVLARVKQLEGDGAQAARLYDDQARSFQRGELYASMALALESAGGAYEELGDHGAAADRYFRAGRSLYYGGQDDLASRALERALPAAGRAQDNYLETQAGRLLEEMAPGRGK